MSYRSTLIQSGNTLILICVLSGGYFLLGLLGILFRIPTDPIWIIMPSAGFGFAASLLFGLRILPAIVIGSFCVCAWFFNFNADFIYLYAVSAIGSAFSAWLAYSLTHSLTGFPNALVEGKSIILFLCVVGPLSHIVPSVISSAVMYDVGIISLTDIPKVGLSWWVADILGMLIFTPIFLIFFAEPHQLWSRRLTTVGLPIATVFTLVCILFFYNNHLSQEQYSKQLQEKTITLSEALKNRIQLDLTSIHGLQNVLLDKKSVDVNQFSLLTQQIQHTLKEIQAIRWVALTDDEKPIINLGTMQLIPADVKQKLLAASTNLDSDFLLPDKKNLKLYVPVKQGDDHNNKMVGVLVVNLSIDRLVQQSIDNLNTDHCPIVISISQSADHLAKTIFSNADTEDHTPCHSNSFNLIGQTWLINFYHDWNNNLMVNKPSAKWIVYVGFWCTGILGIILLFLTGRSLRTEALIEERTNILTETKVAAELANQAKNQFLAKISHELRTPLNGIFGFTQLLEKRSTLSIEDKKQVAIIKQCSDDLLRLINDILDISSIETRQIKLEINDFKFAMLLEDCIRVCKFSADNKGLKLLTKNACMTEILTGDEKRIRQILVNLIDNAIKYTNQGSVTVSATYHNGHMKISVADTGIGIAKQDLERIFSPFIQLNTHSFKQEGIGLGLSITKELVHLMSGDVIVNSQHGSGSMFTVILPLPLSSKNETKVVADLPKEERYIIKTKVLAVDDNEVNLIFLVSMLKQLGCQVDCAADGQEAFALIEKNTYHFALIDINMPIMNGVVLVQKLREQKSTLKLVAVSAYADDAKINEALAAGFDTYIIKPIIEQQLVELIQEANSQVKTSQAD